MSASDREQLMELLAATWRDRAEKTEAELAAERKKNEFLNWLVKQMREALEYVRDNTGEEGIFVAAREALEGKETGD